MIDNLAADISVSVLDKVKDRTDIWHMEFCFHMPAGAGKGAAALSGREGQAFSGSRSIFAAAPNHFKLFRKDKPL